MAWINTPQWDKAQERWAAFWAGEIVDRPATLMTVPSGQPTPAEPEPPDGETKYGDPEFALQLNDALLPRHVYLCEALPVSKTLLRAWCAAFGFRTEYRLDTIWFEPSLTDWDDAPDWETAWDCEGWRGFKRAYARLCEGCRGRYFVGMPPLLMPNDMLPMFRGVENFLMDLVERPEVVLDALAAMRRGFVRIWNEADAIRGAEHGYGNWWPIWCPDRLRIIQSDVSCMLSSAMFERFILPELHELGDDVDHLFYHLDGPDAIRHLDMICSLPKLRAVQWVPGSGSPGHGLHWMGLYKQIQSLGKAAWVHSPPSQIESCIRELDPRHLLISTHAGSLDEARALERKMVEWTARYWPR